MKETINMLWRLYIKYIYADHNQSKNVKTALNKCLNTLTDSKDEGLNVGAGHTHIHPQILNLDIFPGKNIDIVGFAESIPVEENRFKLIVTQETLEHVKDPFKAANELYRILKPGGKIYCQLPFIIGYHPGPSDFWRFTKEGIIELLEKQGFIIEEIGITVGGASGYYRISVEFWATIFSLFTPFLYKIFKAIFALFLFPIKTLDMLFKFSPQKDRIPGGYYVIAIKQ